MKLPNTDNAVVDISKLTDYCLSQEHPRGRHKARVFKSALGLSAEDAEDLRGALLAAAKSDDAELSHEDEYGQRYTLDFEMSGPAGEALVRSLWIVRAGEDYARFVSCYVLE